MIRKRYIIATLAALLAVPAFVSAVAPSTQSKFLNALGASKLQYPDSSTAADTAALLAGHDAAYFTLEDTDKMAFTITGYSAGVTERSELRNLNNWNVNATVQTAHANVAVSAQACDQVTIMQIHDDANTGIGAGPNKPLIRIYRSSITGNAHAIIKDDATGATNLATVDLGTMTLGTYYDCDITVDNGTLTVVFGGVTYVNAIDVSYWNFPSYWKAGAYLQDGPSATVRFNELTWPGAKTVVDDDFADVDRTNTGALQADWWSSSKANDDSVEVDANGLGLVTGGSGRGIHGTFTPQNLAIGETLTTTLSFTTPATVGTDKSGGLKVALMDFNNAGLAADLLSESATSNPLYENLPGYYIEFDVNKALDDDDITIRKHNVPNVIGRFLGTSTEWTSLGNSADVGYGFDASKDYTVVLTVTRTGADTMDVSGILQDENGAVLDIHTEEDASSIANHFGMLGIWVNGSTFGSLNTHGVGADNGITITNAKVELVNLTYNQAPAFTFDPTVEANATQDVAYSATLAGDASDLEGDALTFAKVSGPAWLSVASNGDLTGTPAVGDVGLNDFVVSVVDTAGSNTIVQADLDITVDAATSGPTTIVDDNFIDLDRDKTSAVGDPLDAAWWSSSQTSGSNVEIDANGLGLVTGSSGRGMHGTFDPQTLDVGGKLIATLYFTTPATIAAAKNDALKFALMDFNNAGLADDLSSSSSSVNPLYTNFPGYAFEFDVYSAPNTSSDTRIRKSLAPNTSGRFLGTSGSSDWTDISSSADANYGFTAATDYVVVLTAERTNTDEMVMSASLALAASPSTIITSHSITDASSIANNFGVLGVWVNSSTFGTSNSAGVGVDNGITFTNVTITSEGTTVGNSAPVFDSDPILESDATYGVAYSGTLADNASDVDTDTLTFAKVSGPAWLSVASNGDLTGTPAVGDLGLNEFVVSVVDAAGSNTTVQADLDITVVAPFAGGTLFDDSFADVDRTATGTGAGGTEVDANWWGSSGTSAIEIDATGLGLRSGTSGRGIHGTFTAQTLAVGDSITATMTFTTPATVGTGKSTALKFALMDLNNGALASDVGTANALWSGVPGYMVDFDVNTGSAANITVREHDLLDTQGKFMGTTSEWDSLGGSPDIGYSFTAATSYVVVIKATRTNTASLDIFASLSLASGGAPLATHTQSDVDGTIANNFGLLGAWVNSGTFGSTADAGVADNGITFTNIKVETALDVSGNAAPVATDNSGSVDELAAIGEDVLTVVATDDSAISGFEIIAGNTGDAFTIDSSGLIEAAAGLSLANSPYTLTVQATDDGTPGLKDTATVTITVNPAPATNQDLVSEALAGTGGPFDGETDLAIIGVGADPDGDGNLNFMEVWQGTDASISDMPTALILEEHTESAVVRGSVVIETDSAQDDALAIVVEASTDLTGLWRDITANRIVESDSGGVRTLRFYDTVAVGDEFFIRFSIDPDTAP